VFARASALLTVLLFFPSNLHVVQFVSRYFLSSHHHHLHHTCRHRHRYWYTNGHLRHFYWNRRRGRNGYWRRDRLGCSIDEPRRTHGQTLIFSEFLCTSVRRKGHVVVHWVESRIVRARITVWIGASPMERCLCWSVSNAVPRRIASILGSKKEAEPEPDRSDQQLVQRKRPKHRHKHKWGKIHLETRATKEECLHSLLTLP
jgi:hypothetical protein